MRTRRHVAAVVAAIATLAAVAAVSIAAVSTGSGRTVQAVRAVSDPAARTTTSTSFVDVASATTTISVPSGTQGLILARFSAVSLCEGGITCVVRILVDGVEANPANGLGFAWDVTASGGARAGARMMERYITVGPGSHRVKVQFAADGVGRITLNDWVLVVERALV